MFGSILVLFLVPWLDTSPVRSAQVPADLAQLIWVSPIAVRGARRRRRAPAGGHLGRARPRRTPDYFLHFLVILPVLGKLERPLPLPESISRAGAWRAAAGRCRRVPPPSRWRRHDARPCVALLAAATARRARRRAGGPLRGAGRGHGRAGAALELRRPVRHLRPRGRPARLPGLLRGLLDLPLAEASATTATWTGIGLTEEQIKADRRRSDGAERPNDDGAAGRAPGAAVRPFPFALSRTTRPRAPRNNGALPPDLSLIVKAREGGADYVYALLTGYGDPPAGMKIGDGMNYNKFFPGHQIAMPPPLSDDQVTYADGTKATVEQMAHDVVTFLTWVANPEMEQRKQIGVKVVLFLVLLTGLIYAVKRKVWADVH